MLDFIQYLVILSYFETFFKNGNLLYDEPYCIVFLFFLEIKNNNQSLNERLKKLINSAQVMLFMKGNQATPKCGRFRVSKKAKSKQNINFFKDAIFFFSVPF